MSELIITRGVPGSGKTTGALKWLAEDPEHRARVNRDDIRKSVYGADWGGGIDENVVTQIADAAIRYNLKAGRSVIVDATHLVAKNAKAVAKIGHEFDAKVSFMDFPVTYDLAVVRNKFRKAKGERSVDEKVINERFFQRFHIDKETGKLPDAPKLDKPVSHVWEPYTHNDKLGHAIIVDIDGTLAHMDDRRGPYDTSKYHLDRFDWIISQLIYSYKSHDYAMKVIVMSGRDEEFRDVTEAWMAKFGFEWDEFYMRPKGDLRNDAVVKNEVFEKYVAGRYSIDFILDDRDRVIRMWRDKGLRAYQVADGAF